MDDLKAIRELYGRRETPSAAVQERIRSRIGSPPKIGISRKGMVGVGAGVLAMAAAASVVVATAVTGAPGQSGPAPDQPVALGGVSGKGLLLAAAESAEKSPFGRYLHTDIYWWNRAVIQNDGDPYMIEAGESEWQWLPREKGVKTQVGRQKLGVRPVSAADKAAWKRAGSPSTVTDHEGEKWEVGPPSRPTAGSFDPPSFWVGESISIAELLRLPTEPEALRKWLIGRYKDREYPAASIEKKERNWIFSFGEDLALSLPATPKTRAAAFRMLAGLEGVRLVDHTKDPAGRPASMIAIRQPRGKAELEHRLYYDARDGRGLATEYVVLKPAGSYKGYKPGSVSTYSVYKASGWTHEPPPGQ